MGQSNGDGSFVLADYIVYCKLFALSNTLGM